MPYNTHYVAGEWNVICQRCGLQYKSGELALEWTGLRVCKSCWETRHPQTLIQVPEDDPSIPWSAPEPTDVFIGTGDPLLLETADLTNDPSFWILAQDGTPLLTEP